jgi:beta-lactamase/hydrolase/phosphatase family protein
LYASGTSCYPHSGSETDDWPHLRRRPRRVSRPLGGAKGNLRLPIEQWTGNEEETVKAQRLRYVAVPINPLTFGAEEVAAVRAVLDDESAGPVLLHCASANRSAAVWGVIEVERGRPLDEVEAEASKVGMTSATMVEAFRRVARERAAPRQ